MVKNRSHSFLNKIEDEKKRFSFTPKMSDKVAIRTTSIRPSKDPSVYYAFGIKQPDGLIHLVEHGCEGLKWTNVKEGDYAMGFDEPLNYTPIWDKLTGKTYQISDSACSRSIISPHDGRDHYKGLHSVTAH